jgi:lambda repressor-like predicted transcriptional regulator
MNLDAQPLRDLLNNHKTGGHSLGRLAIKAGLKPETVHRIWVGERRYVTPKTANALARALDRNPATIWPDWEMK